MKYSMESLDKAISIILPELDEPSKAKCVKLCHKASQHITGDILNTDKSMALTVITQAASELSRKGFIEFGNENFYRFFDNV